MLRHPSYISHSSGSVPVLAPCSQLLRKPVPRYQPAGLCGTTAFAQSFHHAQPGKKELGVPAWTPRNTGPKRGLVAVCAHGAPAPPSPPRKGPHRNSPWQKVRDMHRICRGCPCTVLSQTDRGQALQTTSNVMGCEEKYRCAHALSEKHPAILFLEGGAAAHSRQGALQPGCLLGPAKGLANQWCPGAACGELTGI
eukprot:1158776-Pelagomonas_calceolata.AAC.2